MSGPAGVEEHGIGTAGFPGNLGRPAAPPRQILAWGLPDHEAPGPRPASGLGGETKTGARGGIAKRSTNEARRDGPQGIGALHSTDEAGEPNPRGPGGGKGAPGHGTVGRKHGRCIGTGSRVNETTTDSGAGEAGPADGVHFAQPPPGPPLAVRGLQPDAARTVPRAWTDRRATTTGCACVDNLTSLLDRAKSGTYSAPPVRRVHIPKGTGQRDPSAGDPDA